jgi:hypothetical protein
MKVQIAYWQTNGRTSVHTGRFLYYYYYYYLFISSIAVENYSWICQGSQLDLQNGNVARKSQGVVC